MESSFKTLQPNYIDKVCELFKSFICLSPPYQPIIKGIVIFNVNCPIVESDVSFIYPTKLNTENWLCPRNREYQSSVLNLFFLYPSTQEELKHHRNIHLTLQMNCYFAGCLLQK